MKESGATGSCISTRMSCTTTVELDLELTVLENVVYLLPGCSITVQHGCLVVEQYPAMLHVMSCQTAHVGFARMCEVACE